MARVERGVVEAARLVEDEGTFRALAPALADRGPVAPTPGDGSLAPPGLPEAGYAAVSGLIAGPDAAAMGRAVRELAAREIPTPFAYVWDAFWAPAAPLLAWAKGHVADYELVDDAWAWVVMPGTSGWAAHRGTYAPSPDRARPDVLNVWIALSDVAADGGAMHLAALDRDPAYPDALRDVTTGAPAAVAVPCAAGDALVWDANVLHWGGACAEARPPRVSFSYTLRRRGSGAIPGARAIEPGALDFRARLDLIASQLVTYGELAPDIHAGFREWAVAVVGARSFARHRP